MKCLGTFIITIFILLNTAYSQITPQVAKDTTLTDDPIIINSDKTLENAELIEMYSKRFNPRRAGLYSAVLPGLGQAYNKKYWKIPIVYGGFIGLGFGVNFYQKQHKKFRNELFTILDSGESTSASGLNETQLRSIIDRARRERDYLLILSGVLYLLNVADAHIDSHLKEFDLNEKLKLTLDPMLRQQNELQAGITLGLNFH